MATGKRQAFRNAVARTLLALGLAGLADTARAIDLSAYVQEGYSLSDGTATSGSTVSHLESQAFLQKYQLGLNQTIFPSLRLDATGYLNWAKGWTDTDGVWAKNDSKLWDASARLGFGSQPIAGQLYFDLAQNMSESTTAGVTHQVPTVSRENFGFNGRWMADGLPTLSLTLERTNSWDSEGTRDATTDLVFLVLQYSPVRGLNLNYALRYLATEDHVSLLTSDLLGHTWGAGYSDRMADGRINYAVSYNASYTTQTAHAPSASATVPMQRLPSSGFSLVEAITDTPQLDKLNANPALIDGNVTVSAGIDIGYAPSAAGDTSYRDIGATFADPLTEVNQIYVYVDRRLPAEIVAAWRWTAYSSDDNQSWTAVPIVSAVTFGAIDNRFEIRTNPTRARYFKVVTRPLPLGTTVDKTYANVYVSEIQLYDIVAAGSLPRSSNSLAETAAFSSHLILVPALNLVYDLSGLVFQSSATDTHDRVSWNVGNGVAAGGQVSRILTLTGRLEDFIGSQQIASGPATTSELRLTAAAVAQFLPTLRASFTYQLQHAFAVSALARTYHAFLFAASADLYTGVSLALQGGYTYGTQGLGQEFANATASSYLTVVPTPLLTLTFGANYSDVQTRYEGQPWASTRTGVLQASFTYTPIPALSLNASVTRYAWYTVPTTTFAGAATFSPFPGGKLLLSFVYNQYFDTANGINTLQWGPSLRWTLRPGVFVDASYTRQRVRFTDFESLSNVVSTNLTIAL
jgi:hypothetical protein